MKLLRKTCQYERDLKRRIVWEKGFVPTMSFKIEKFLEILEDTRYLIG